MTAVLEIRLDLQVTYTSINKGKMTIFNLKICLEQTPIVSPVNFYLKLSLVFD